MADIVRKALNKSLAALQGAGLKPVVMGGLARQAWGAKIEATQVDLLIPLSEAKRDQILSNARGEGFQQAAGGPIPGEGGAVTLRFTYTDAKIGSTVTIDVVEAGTPAQKQMLTRAKDGVVLDILVPLASCEELILASVNDSEPLIELLRATAGRMDAGYLKKEAEAAGVFDKIKVAWQQAKARG